MEILIKAIMAGLMAATALAVIGTSASAAFGPKDLGIHQNLFTQQKLFTRQLQETGKPQRVKMDRSEQNQKICSGRSRRLIAMGQPATNRLCWRFLSGLAAIAAGLPVSA